MSAWTDERRAKQAAMIRQRRPWERSTGPRTPEGKAKAAGNRKRYLDDLQRRYHEAAATWLELHAKLQQRH